MVFDKWLFFQLGAREHYIVPRALHERGILTALFTDAWVDPCSSQWPILRTLSSRLVSRFEPGLKNARVEHFTKSLISFETRRALLGKRSNSWKDIIARNRWFQRQVVKRLGSIDLAVTGERAVFHAFSYAAREIFATAKRSGHLTVLQQIDPGLAEEELVGERCLRSTHLTLDWAPAPREYWQDWLEECRLADVIVVNSEWSRRGLLGKNIPSAKILTIPLMYDPTNQVSLYKRTFPDRFDDSAPLKVLFLGNLCVRKGIAEMLEVVELLRSAPVKFCFVGPSEIRVPDRFRANPKIEWHAAVPHAQVHDFYRRSHVFILPTHSDGFGLTQLEAQAWALPVIASLNCGKVVRHGQNGLLLPAVSGAAIAEAIGAILDNPAQLPVMSRRSRETAAEHTAERIIPQLFSGVSQILAKIP